ncbi:MAG: gliding motility lipoprotein GldD [Prolixibacteraceae bacterium]|nr:gliding motility lipoprotein GldD [Prolixibacteraceae bacterium]
MVRLPILYAIIFSIFLLCGSCKEKYTPKPRGYFRIDFPEKNYQFFHNNYPFSFEYPVYAETCPDKSVGSEPYWMNILFEANNATIHLSYKAINNNLATLTEDSHELVYKHAIKASAINEKIYSNPRSNVYGTLYEIKGNAASPFQFHLTDSVNHFLRGSFYFNEQPNYDSLYPVIDFLKEDIIHLVETFSWK